MPLLCFDIPWNEGCTYPINVVTTPGSVLDAQPPAACSNPSVSFRAADGALSALSKALINSPLRERLTANWDGSPPIVLGMAPGPPGHPPIMIPMLEGMSGGGGAFSFKDGLDAGSMLCIMEYSMGDVETQENAYPILFLTRRFLKDSGGPGRYRGGAGCLVAIVPHRAPGLKFFLLEDRRLVPSHGTAGGYPGAAHHFFVRRGADTSHAIRQGLGSTDEALAQLELLPAHTVLDLGPQDVFAFTSNAGGGFGDPINRDSQGVARDVRWGFVSAEKAKKLYGVVLKPGTLEVDEVKTGEERDTIRQRRSKEGTASHRDSADGDYISLDEGEKIPVCSGCGQRLASREENWKENVPREDLRMDATGMFIPGDDRVVLRQYTCPACGMLLDSEVTLAGLKPLRDFREIASSG
jgi:N-methylhydantoinase B